MSAMEETVGQKTDWLVGGSQVDYEDLRVRIVVHIYEPYIKACHTLNRYLEELARRYPRVKFLRIQVRIVLLSHC